MGARALCADLDDGLKKRTKRKEEHLRALRGGENERIDKPKENNWIMIEERDGKETIIKGNGKTNLPRRHVYYTNENVLCIRGKKKKGKHAHLAQTVTEL